MLPIAENALQLDKCFIASWYSGVTACTNRCNRLSHWAIILLRINKPTQ